MLQVRGGRFGSHVFEEFTFFFSIIQLFSVEKLDLKSLNSYNKYFNVASFFEYEFLGTYVPKKTTGSCSEQINVLSG